MGLFEALAAPPRLRAVDVSRRRTKFAAGAEPFIIHFSLFESLERRGSANDAEAIATTPSAGPPKR